MRFPANIENVLSRATGGALVADESGIILFASDKVCRLLKYAPGELDRQSVECLMPERFRLSHVRQRLCFTDDRRTRPMGSGVQLFALCKDGSELPVDVSLSPVQRGLETLIVVSIQVR